MSRTAWRCLARVVPLGLAGSGACALSSAADAPVPSRGKYRYLICGGGVAAREALAVMSEREASRDVLVVTPEWRGPGSAAGEVVVKGGAFEAMRRTIGAWVPFVASTEEGAEIVVGRRVVELDMSRRVAVLNGGDEVAFDKCLLAIGGELPPFPIGKVVAPNAGSLVSSAWTADDWARIESVLDRGASPGVVPHVTVIGGGWLAASVGAACVARGADVTFSYAEPAFLARYFPKYISEELYSRLQWQSDGGIDSLSYSALKYVIGREASGMLGADGKLEAEVHVGVVFDAFSVVEFRTDLVVFAPTLPPVPHLETPLIQVDGGGFVANAELAVASDVYAAGSCVSVSSGGVRAPPGMKWSANHAKATARHATLNMLGAREAYDVEHEAGITVDLTPIALRIHGIGDLDGSAETFGYFSVSRSRDDKTCGGQLARGACFYVAPAPLSHRGAAQKLVVTGVALWDGTAQPGTDESMLAACTAAKSLLTNQALTRPGLETLLDEYCEKVLGFSNAFAARTPNLSETSVPIALAQADAGEIAEDESEGADGTADVTKSPAGDTPFADEREKEPLTRMIWRRHRAARGIPVRKTEVMWVEDEGLGAISGNSPSDRRSQAYTDLLKRSAGV